MEFMLTPRGPYGFGLVLAYLGSSPSRVLENITTRGFCRALAIGPGVVVKVERENLSASTDPLHITLWAKDLTPSLVNQVRQHLRKMLTLDVDGTIFEDHMLRHDPQLGQYSAHYRGFRPILWGSPWEAFLWGVLEQNMEVNTAQTIKSLVRLGGEHLIVHDQIYNLLPTPDWFLHKPTATLLSIGMTHTKAMAIIQVAEAIAMGALPWSSQPEESQADTLTQLQKIPGVGLSTAATVGLGGLGNLDILPAEDASLQIFVGRHIRPDGSQISAGALQEYAIRWAPYRGWATYLLWLQIQAEAMIRQADAFDSGGNN